MSLSTSVGLQFTARDRSRAGIMSLHRNLGNLNRRFFTLGRTLLTVAGIGGIGYMIKQQMAMIDSTAKLSDRLGITTEALISLQHGAQIAGIQQETMNKSLEIFSRRLGEVDMGVGEAKNALDKLGLNYAELINKSPDKAIGIVADQMNLLGTQSEKAAAANYLFGRSGQQLLNLFESGSAGIEAYKKEVEKLGLSFSRIDAAKVEAANDALTRTRAVFTGLFRSVTIEVSPYIEAAAIAFNNFATQGEGVGHNVTRAFEIMTVSIIRTGEEIEGLVVKIGRLTSPVETMQKNFEAMRIAKERYLAATGEGRRIKPGQPELFNQLYMEERTRLGIEPSKSRISETQKWFENLRANATSKTQANSVARPIEVEASRMAVGAIAEQVSNTEKLIASMKRENELLVMNTAERFKAEAVDRAILAAQKDKVELTEQQLAKVEELASKNYRIAEEQKYGARDITEAYVRMYEDIGSKSDDYYAERRRLLRFERDEYAKVIFDKALLDEWYKAKLKKLDEERLAKDILPIGGEQIHSATDIAAAYSRMYSEMDSKSAASFEARRQLLRAEYNNYAEYIEDKAALNEWLNDRINRLEEDRLAASESIMSGIRSAWMQMQREVMTVGEITKKVALDMADGFAGSMAATLVRGEDFKENMKRIMLEIIEYLVKVQIMKSILGIGGLFGSPGGEINEINMATEGAGGVHQYRSGGIVGQGSSFRTVNPAVFSGAPRFGSGGVVGLRPNEVPIIAHRGEKITPAGGSEGGLDVRIHNEGSDDLVVQSAKTYLQSDQRIIDVIVKSRENSGPLRRTFKRR